MAVIASSRQHLSKTHALSVHVVDFGLGDEIRARVTKAVASSLPHTTIEFLTLPPDRLEHFPKPSALSHVTLVTYARLLLHELLPAIDRIVYLDCDLLVTVDLSELTDLSLNGNILAAAIDTVIPQVSHERESLVKDLPGIDPSLPYFNAGVLLMDLKQLRAINATALFTDILRKVECRYADQSVLNAAFHGRWSVLAPRWNRQTLLGDTFNVYPDTLHAIWHFSSRLKPWQCHRSGARGLLARWFAVNESVSWTPTATPTTRVCASRLKDTVKSIRSWLHRKKQHPAAYAIEMRSDTAGLAR